MVTKEQSATYLLGNPEDASSALTITIVDTSLYSGTDQEILRPNQVIAHTRNSTVSPWVEAVTRTINSILSQPLDFAFVANELKQVFDNAGGYTNASGVHVLSVASELGLVLEHHFKDYSATKGFRQETPEDRPAQLSGKTYKITPPLKDSSVYLTVNDRAATEDGTAEYSPFEIFLRSDDPEEHQWQNALCTLVSAALRQNSSAEHIINELKTIESVDGYFAPGFGHCSSTVSHLARVIEKHCIECIQASEPVQNQEQSSDADMVSV